MRNSDVCRKEMRAGENPLLSRWATTLGRRKDEPAIYQADRTVLRTFSEIESESAVVARDLAAFPPGSVIALQLGNDPLWPAALLACFRLGLAALPVGRHLGHAELDAALAICSAAALLSAPDGRLAIAVRDGAPPGDPSIDLLKLTSGTTSAPRAIRFRAGQLVADCDNICNTMGISGEDLNFGVIPFSHSYGFNNLLTPLICRGVRLVASEDRMPRAILNGLAESGATVFPGMRVFCLALAGLRDRPPLPALRLCVSAGAPLTRAIGEAFTAAYGLKIHTFYGSSECGGIGYDRSEEPIYDEGFVGTAMDGVRIEPFDEAGVQRIRIRSEAVGDGYFPDPDEETLGNGGFVPADLVTVNGRGMFLAGRLSDVINVAGRKLNPLEVEARVATFPGVRQVVVFGVASALRHEEAIACIAGDPGLEPDAVLRHCRSVLSGWQVPKAIWIVPEIPVNDRGKISRRELARMYEAQA